jgi:hypothetical protein
MNIRQHIDNGDEVMARNPDIEVEVLKTDMGGEWPILIIWKSKYETIWRTAKYKSDGIYQSLTQDPPSNLDLIPKRPNLKDGDPVVVWSDGGKRQNRYFKEWRANGRICCWGGGRTKWSADDITDCIGWDNYELPEEFEKVIY